MNRYRNSLANYAVSAVIGVTAGLGLNLGGLEGRVNSANAGNLTIHNLSEERSGTSAQLNFSSLYPEATSGYDADLDNLTDITQVPDEQFLTIDQSLYEGTTGDGTLYAVNDNWTQHAQLGDTYTFRLSAVNRRYSTFLIHNYLEFDAESIEEVFQDNPNGVEDLAFGIIIDANCDGDFIDPWDYSSTGLVSDILKNGKATESVLVEIQSTFSYTFGNSYGQVFFEAIKKQESYNADFDGDGDVDSDDFNTWRTGFGTLTGATILDGDTDSDGDVDGYDFLNWQKEFGNTTTGNGEETSINSTTIPEPTSLGLGLAGIVLGSAGLGAYSKSKGRKRRKNIAIIYQ